MGTPVLIPNTEVKHCSGDDTLLGKVANRQHKVFNTRATFNEVVFVILYTRCHLIGEQKEK